MAKTTQSFNAEIKQLLDLMIHSLYSHKEIFLRELISNASDAIDKLKFQSLTHPDLVPAGNEFYIRVQPNKENKTLAIIDNGIGMSTDEVVQFIGTIAHSGTKKFAQLNEELKTRPELIGQFGVGFYSSFMVAEKVVLHTQKAGDSTGTLWESTGDGSYTIDEIPRAEGVGTTITLFLKTFEAEEEVQDFTDVWVLKSLVKKYSDFIAYPIKMLGDFTPEDKEPAKDEVLNSQKALWLRPAAEVSSEDYKAFYQHLTNDWNEPLKTIHYKAEGTMEFNAMMFIPTKKPWNFNTRESQWGLSLYVKRVFIMEDCQDLLPSYLRFVKGLVDSSDLSLNVSREILQKDRQVLAIKKNVVNKVFATLKDLLIKDRTGFENFWTEFGTTLKEGIPTEPGQKDKLQELFLFHTSDSDKMTNLEEYVGRMKPEQKDIFFITGESLAQLAQSPYLEKLKEKNYEVLFLVDAVDEWVMQGITDYKEKKLVNIAKSNLDLDTAEEKTQKEEQKKTHLEKYATLIERFKKALEKEVKDVVISDRLTTTPVCLVSDENDPSANMQKIIAQMGRGESMAAIKRILEINPKHELFDKMLLAGEQQQMEWAEMLYAQALINEGSQIPDPAKFSKQFSNLLLKALN